MNAPKIAPAEKNHRHIAARRIIDCPAASEGSVGGLPTLTIPQMTPGAVGREKSCFPSESRESSASSAEADWRGGTETSDFGSLGCALTRRRYRTNALTSAEVRNCKLLVTASAIGPAADPRFSA